MGFLVNQAQDLGQIKLKRKEKSVGPAIGAGRRTRTQPWRLSHGFSRDSS